MGKIYKNGIEYGGGGGSAAGGHTILDSDGNTMPTEDNLQFKGLDVTDNSTDGVTEVESAGLNQDSMDDVLSASASGVQVASDGMSYSTEEQVVGRWIDGKPLYQRVIDCGAIPAGAQNGYNMITFNNIGHMHFIFGYTDISANLPYFNPLDNAASGIGFQIDINNSSHDAKFILFTTKDRSAFGHLYICVQYTKTTD